MAGGRAVEERGKGEGGGKGGSEKGSREEGKGTKERREVGEETSRRGRKDQGGEVFAEIEVGGGLN